MVYIYVSKSHFSATFHISLGYKKSYNFAWIEKLFMCLRKKSFCNVIFGLSFIDLLNITRACDYQQWKHNCNRSSYFGETYSVCNFFEVFSVVINALFPIFYDLIKLIIQSNAFILTLSYVKSMKYFWW